MNDLALYERRLSAARAQRSKLSTVPIPGVVPIDVADREIARLRRRVRDLGRASHVVRQRMATFAAATRVVRPSRRSRTSRRRTASARSSASSSRGDPPGGPLAGRIFDEARRDRAVEGQSSTPLIRVGGGVDERERFSSRLAGAAAGVEATR